MPDQASSSGGSPPATTDHNRRRFCQFRFEAAGHRFCMLENLAKGAMAGLARTSALNAAGYGDMALRGGAASSAPARVVEELAKRGGRAVPGDS